MTRSWSRVTTEYLLKPRSNHSKTQTSARIIFSSRYLNPLSQALSTKNTFKHVIENNVKYVILVARRLGAKVFLIWEQIRDVFLYHKSLG